MKKLMSFILTCVFVLSGCDKTTSSDDNVPPFEPSVPSPADGATDVSITPTLSWSGGDPDIGDVVTYTLVLAGSNGDSLVTTTTQTSIGLTGLSHSVNYAWGIVAEDLGGATASSDVWTFTTAPLYSENFESHVVPGTFWAATDVNSSDGGDYWGDQLSSSGARVHGGIYSAYCADNSDVIGQSYDNEMDSYMRMLSGPNITGYTNVQLSYWMYYDTEADFDFIQLQYWNGASWALVANSTLSGFANWNQYTVPFSGSGTLLLAWVFFSDETITDEGVYIDDILITGNPPSATEPDNLDLSKSGPNIVSDTGILPGSNQAPRWIGKKPSRHSKGLTKR